MTPIKIALLGAPSSGKTDTADAFTEAVQTSPDSRFDDRPWKVLDDPEHGVAMAGRGLGSASTYVENLMVTMRDVWKVDCVSPTHHVLNCGTVVAHLAHLSALLDQLHVTPESPDHVHEQAQRLMTAGYTLSLLLVDTFDYDHVFKIQLDPMQPRSSFVQLVDGAIDEVLKRYAIPHTMLFGTPQDRASQMLDKISPASSEPQ